MNIPLLLNQKFCLQEKLLITELFYCERLMRDMIFHKTSLKVLLFFNATMRFKKKDLRSARESLQIAFKSILFSP